MDSVSYKAGFLARMHSPQQMQLLFNHLPDVYFFAKNREGRFVMGNDHFVRQCGATTESDIIGKTDFDFFPLGRAESYVQDDNYVMETGESIIDRVELAPDPGNSINWFITCKVPVYSIGGEIIGLAGTARDITRAGLALRPYTEMRAVLEFVRDNYSRPIEIKELAALVHLSISQFERRFRKVFQISPLKHIMNVRIRAASLRLTASNDTIATIALDCGFYDHSHFTRNFRKIMGVSPKEYRKQYVS
ncbi:AraC family transcriptional regulator [Pontiella sulfatireligans]|uniref:Melibiose operon regulatory protein n=1 Tax=Pontiella sulfatireligans TaxID=2750658 RepID=A0A6C2UIX2_9BACT|nr:AraC family transcriptional regulator [Pontiella sulfatireligans]VGO20160.1 Melibiose operon regulatory protein [Pontiella sulfatireligans]